MSHRRVSYAHAGTKSAPGAISISSLVKIPRTLLSLTWLLLLISIASTVIAAQPQVNRFKPCEPAGEFIELKVRVKTIPATGTAPVKRFWIVDLSNRQVVVDPSQQALGEQIVGVLNDFAQTSADNNVDIGVGIDNPVQGDPPQLHTLLVGQINDANNQFNVVLPEGLKLPPLESDENQTYPVRLCLNYKHVKPPGRVQINISTLGGGSAPLQGVPAFTLADASDRFRGQPQAAIPVSLAYAQQDVDDARKDPSVTTEEAAHQRVRAELLKVAGVAFDKAVAARLLDAQGNPLVGQSDGGARASQTQDEIVQVYNLNRASTLIRWGIVNSSVQLANTSSPGEAVWNISVSGLQLAQRVNLFVFKSATESEFDGSETEKKFRQKRVLVWRALRDKYLADGAPARLLARPGHIITTEDIQTDQQTLSKDEEFVRTVGDASSGTAPETGLPPQNLIYMVSRPLKAEKNLSLKMGGGYSPEDEGTGNVSLNESNLLGISEQAKLELSGGPQVQKIRFNLTRPFEESGKAGWSFKELGINVQYFRDRDYRLSNLTLEEIEAREAGSEARLSFVYDSFGMLDVATAECLEHEARKRTRFYFLATPVFGYRDVNIKEDDLLLTVSGVDRSLLPRARTQTTTLTLNANLGLTHDFRQAKGAGPGLLNIFVDARSQRGFRLFGADYSYNKTYVAVTGEIFFGSTSTRDFFLRYNRVMGTSNRGTPIFELFRLGGPQTVRGMEEGEFIGRKMSADQFEFGVNALVLWQLVTGNSQAKALRKSECAGDAVDEQPKPPFDISKFYLKVFYDRGRVHDDDSFNLPFTLNRVAQGYGLAFELRELGGQKINLSIGYAYSPESRLHDRGTLYTGVSYIIR